MFENKSLNIFQIIKKLRGKSKQKIRGFLLKRPKRDRSMAWKGNTVKSIILFYERGIGNYFSWKQQIECLIIKIW